MTKLIYRGFPHDPIAAPEPRVARTLVYRGALHDGLGPRPAAPAGARAMQYRGVAYVLAANGAVLPARPAAGPRGEVAAAI
jgi:hypothetical protein